MRIKMLASFAGTSIDWPAGSEQELEAKEAVRLIEAGYAVPVATVKVETAAAAPVREKRKK